MVHEDDARFQAVLAALQDKASQLHARVRRAADAAKHVGQFQTELLTAVEQAF